MESESPRSMAGSGDDDKPTLNGDYSASPNVPLAHNHCNNIDDISTPSDLKFDEEFEFEESYIIDKRKEIEKCLEKPDSIPLEVWQTFARSKGGLISDKYRKTIWPLLVGVAEEEMTEPPSLEELSTHSEYSQVVLDVGRSLKRFPPGVPYVRRLALQDQLTVLILRVIIEYPHLKYYQGYHDVAITLLLVIGARGAFPVLARLSGPPAAPLAAYMSATMRPAQHRLNHVLPALRRVRPDLAAHLHRSQVGTMFALPWCLTWFGHSLPRYSDVVRLYDFFLCEPPLMPIYVTAAVVIHRADEVLQCECDMAPLHCLLSKLPDDLPFEDILCTGRDLYTAHPPASLLADVRALEDHEAAVQREEDARRVARRRVVARRGAGPRWAWRPRLVLACAAALLGVYVYYRPELLFDR